MKNCNQRMINSLLFIVFLKIRWWLVGENIKSANDTIVGKETYGVVYGISKGYVYALRVLGFSKGGDGKMSPTQYFTLGKYDVARSRLQREDFLNFISMSFMVKLHEYVIMFKLNQLHGKVKIIHICSSYNRRSCTRRFKDFGHRTFCLVHQSIINDSHLFVCSTVLICAIITPCHDISMKSIYYITCIYTCVLYNHHFS